jgi:DHA1 family tetracycline resistance protein-like MFS transporter
MPVGINRKQLIFILATIIIDMIGLGIIVPVAPRIIMDLTQQGYAAAAQYSGWLTCAFAAMLFLFAPLVGNLSDAFGRRPVLLVSMVALGCDYLITGLAPTLGWLFVGRVLSGMAGTSYMTANAYIADLTPPEKRAANFGLLGTAFSIGFIIGPAIGGWLGARDPRLPFYVAAAMSFANSALGFIVLQESLLPQNRRKFDWRRANPFGALKAVARLPHALALLTGVAMVRFALDASPSTFAFYCYLKFNWTSAQVGTAMMCIAACMAVVFRYGVRLSIKHAGEINSAMLGVACGIVAFTGYAFASAGWQMFVFIAVFAPMGLIMPSITSMLSKEVGPSGQGELQGALASVGGLTAVGAPLVTTHIFARFTAADAPIYFPGAAFLLGAGILAVTLVVLQQLRMRISALPAAAASSAQDLSQ